jgi:hypothetical protein
VKRDQLAKKVRLDQQEEQGLLVIPGIPVILGILVILVLLDMQAIQVLLEKLGQQGLQAQPV